MVRITAAPYHYHHQSQSHIVYISGSSNWKTYDKYVPRKEAFVCSDWCLRSILESYVEVLDLLYHDVCAMMVGLVFLLALVNNPIRLRVVFWLRLCVIIFCGGGSFPCVSWYFWVSFVSL